MILFARWTVVLLWILLWFFFDYSIIYMYKVVKLHQLSCIGLLIERADDSKYSFCYMFSSIHGCKFWRFLRFFLCIYQRFLSLFFLLFTYLSNFLITNAGFRVLIVQFFSFLLGWRFVLSTPFSHQFTEFMIMKRSMIWPSLSVVIVVYLISQVLLVEKV